MRKQVKLTLLLFTLLLTSNATTPLQPTSQASNTFSLTIDVSTLGYTDTSTLGTAEDATEEFDPKWDTVETPAPPRGITSYLWYPGNPASPVDLRKLSTSMIPWSGNMTWTLHVKAIAISGQAALTWNPSETGQLSSTHEIHLLDGEGKAPIDMRSASRIVFNADEGATYTFTVQVLLHDSPPSKVPALNVTDEHDGVLRLTWGQATDDRGVAYYRVYRDGGLIATTIHTTYRDQGLVNGVPYTYQVSAVDTSGLEGERSDPSNGTPTQSTPHAPLPPANEPPTADAGADQTLYVNTAAFFDASSSSDTDGTLVSYVWAFGDGATSTGVKAVHTYSAAGVYTVTLTVTDDKGEKASDRCNVTVMELSAPLKAVFTVGIPANETNHSVCAFDSEVMVRVNTTGPVTLTVIKYVSNPAPGAPLPRASAKYLDVSVSCPDAVRWPLYVEVGYTSEEITGLHEEKLGIFYLVGDSWRRCSATGVYPDRGVAWARMTREEAAGSPILVGEVPVAAGFKVSALSISPSAAITGETVSVDVTVTNVGGEAGDYTVTLWIDGVLEGSEAVSLGGGESVEVSFNVSRGAAGLYMVEVDGLRGGFTVKEQAEPAVFVYSGLSVSPLVVGPGEAVSVSVTVANVGGESGNHTVMVRVDGVAVGSESVSLEGGGSASLVFTVSAVGEGSHVVQVGELTGSFEVEAAARFPVWFYGGMVAVLVSAVVAVTVAKRYVSTSMSLSLSFLFDNRLTWVI